MERSYTSRDMVRIACSSCEGCGACCRGMGESILLDPYDADRLSKRLEKPFAELLDTEVGMILERGVILPHLMMREDTDACSFLGDDGRCAIHADRPGICRLFPLGRSFENDKVSYFIQEEACGRPGRSKVRISRWLDIPDLSRYEQYKLTWHLWLKRLRERLEEERDEGEVKRVNMYSLKTFFLDPYGEDFYEEFSGRMEQIRRLF